MTLGRIVNSAGGMWRPVAAAIVSLLCAISIAWGGYVLHRSNGHERLEGHPLLLGRYNAFEMQIREDLQEMKRDVKIIVREIGEMRGERGR